jgi:hypothetical protein
VNSIEAGLNGLRVTLPVSFFAAAKLQALKAQIRPLQTQIQTVSVSYSFKILVNDHINHGSSS